MTVVGNRGHETSATTGTGSYSLDGAVENRLTLTAAAARASGDNVGPWTVDYVADDGAGGYETGRGVLTSGAPATLTRDTVRDSSNGGAAVDWGAGTRQIMLAPDALVLAHLYAVESATADATPDTLAKRDGSGRVQVAAPAAAGDAATKGYVDGALGPVQDAVDDAAEAAGSAQVDIDTHAERTDNPHGVTKAQIGLGSVLNQAQLYLTAASVGSSGSLAFSDGSREFILKWGSVASVGAGSSQAVSYGTAFPNGTLAVFTQFRGASFSGSNSVTAGVHSESAAGFSIYNNASISASLYWLAIGH